MKLSTRGEYGTRAMFELALQWDQGPVMLRNIAENQKLSAKYLEQLLTQLKNAGLVRVVRGAKGGFLLSRHPDDIRLREVVNVLEGDLSLVDCVANKDVCIQSSVCVVREVWQEMSHSINEILASRTLADLVYSSTKMPNGRKPVSKSVLRKTPKKRAKKL